MNTSHRLFAQLTKQRSKQARSRKGLNDDGHLASTGRLCTDDDMQQTTLALENSTRAIEEQTRAVESQQEFLNNVRSRQQASKGRNSRQQRHQIQKVAIEIQRLKLIVCTDSRTRRHRRSPSIE